MTVTLEQARTVKRRCINEYAGKTPYSDYVNGCGISKIGIVDRNAPVEEKGNFCVVIKLSKSLPPNLSISSEKDGVKIYTEEIGEIIAS